MRSDFVKYRGVEFPVPDNYRELGITHAVCCDHVMRGPMVHRWQREREQNTSRNLTPRERRLNERSGAKR